MKIGESKNKYGTPVSHHICDMCGGSYTVCPSVDKPDIDNGGLFSNCTMESCASYDPAHDLDAVFESDEEISQRKVVGINALRLRRSGNLQPRNHSDD